ncbi:unnamed protein product [Ilex paraguariensis]|uniref:Glutaredoxin domain-containing protein n=1 Tax=Ilex paraguariensis TaxID=185542 RepID=A0ABC8SBW1_9AQUA
MTDYVETLIHSFGVEYKVYEIDGFQNGQEIKRALLVLGCNSSVPAVFIEKELVVGAKKAIILNLRGELKHLFRDVAINRGIEGGVMLRQGT